MLLPPRVPQSRHRLRIRRAPPRSGALWSEINVKRESGTTLELMRLLVENIETAIQWAEGLMVILRKDLKGNMISKKPESETYSLSKVHSLHSHTHGISYLFYCFTVHWSLSRVITCLEAVKGGIFASSKDILDSDSF